MGYCGYNLAYLSIYLSNVSDALVGAYVNYYCFMVINDGYLICDSCASISYSVFGLGFYFYCFYTYYKYFYRLRSPNKC